MSPHRIPAPPSSVPVSVQPDASAGLPDALASSILLVDGDIGEGGRLARWLQHRGYAVSLAIDPAEAAAMLDVATFDLIVADIDGFGPAGPGWIEQLFLRPGFPPVILTPSRLSLQAAAWAANLPLAGYLPKPVDHDALRTILQRIFGRSYR